MPFATAAKNTMLDSLTVNRVRLHNGNPGAFGTDNALGALTAAVFDAASAGERALNANVTLTGLGASQPVTHVSFWQAAGTLFHGSQTLIGSTTADVDGEYVLLAATTSLLLSDPPP